ncbi:hypothetical protein M758_4G103000 [Ceratodon purpureus]|uniref:Complex III subunit VII n=1 Tax=Ceratodon purpureus TaxID=3225 RepID=A0A8T0I9C0_CERPU|nr:hypothetical protein KC19_4G104700 [Ceratodon purpureus]KAG0618935.1 hypothetical protein M758_4G103000 [Ceratodon purpureus]
MPKFVWAEKCAEMIQKSMGNSFGWCSNWYRAKVAKELKKYGLRYDDLYDEMYDFDIMEALHRLPQQVQDLRNQRLKRAMDCGYKHSYLDKEMQAKQTPYEFYIQDMLAQVTCERKEREAQGSYMPYEREMP